MTLALLFIVFGLFSGIMAGLLGIGGGIVFLPLAKLYFIDYLNYDLSFVKVIIATSSAMIIVNSSSSLYRHIKLKNTVLSFWPYLLFPTLIGSQIGGYFTSIASPEFLKYVLGFFLILAAFKMLFFKRGEVVEQEMTKKNKLLLILAVFLISVFAAMLGIGGGAFMVPVLFMLSGLSFKKVVGTAPMFKLFVSMSSVSFYLLAEHTLPVIEGHLQVGYVDVNLWAYTSIGGFLGAQIGALILDKVPTALVKNVFVFLLFFSAYKMVL